jgi:hypothetical protein
MDWPRLREEITTTAARVAAELRALPRADQPLFRVTWTGAELGAHLVTLPGRYARLAGRPTPPPASLAIENERELVAVPDRDPALLADRLGPEVRRLLDVLGPDGDRPVHYFTVPHTAAGLGGILLAELLVHGLDLADAQRHPWPIRRDQAVAGLRGVLPAAVLLTDPEAARTATGTYHVRIRGGDDWTVVVRDGRAAVRRARPERADLHLSADPVVFLLAAYGVVGPVRAALTGGLLAWGRRPWLAPRVGRLFQET